MKQVSDFIPKKVYRTRGETGVTISFYIPRETAKAMQKVAERDYGGNQSAVVTEALNAWLGEEVKNSEPASV